MSVQLKDFIKEALLITVVFILIHSIEMYLFPIYAMKHIFLFSSVFVTVIISAYIFTYFNVIDY